jgi:hypothetical protein
MAVISVLSLISLLIVGLSVVTENSKSMGVATVESMRSLHAEDLREAISDYFVRNGRYPIDLDQLSSTAPHVVRNLSAVSKPVGFRLGNAVNGFSNEDWSGIQRVSIHAIKADLNASLAVPKIYVDSNNGCGAEADWQAASAWCPRAGHTLYSAVLDPRGQMAREIASQRRRFSRTLTRVMDFYNATRKFPNYGNSANRPEVPWGDRSDTNLAEIAFGHPDPASPPLSFENCSGEFLALYYKSISGGAVHIGLPLGCEDVFDVWGQAVFYQRPTENSVRLVAVSPYTSKVGKRVVVTQELDLTRF